MKEHWSGYSDRDSSIGPGVVGSAWSPRSSPRSHLLGIGALIAGSPRDVRVHSTYTGDALSGWPNDDADTVPDDNAGVSFSNRSSSSQLTNAWAIRG